VTYLLALASRAVQELAALVDRAKSRRARVASASFNAMVRLRTPADFDSFVQDLTRAVAQVIARHHDAEGAGRWFRVIGGAYPGPRPASGEGGRD
jgi:hypothetical protein